MRRICRRAALSAAIAANVILFNGCASGPREADARRMIEQRIQNSANGLITMVDFRKTNGRQAEVLGVKTYEMEYEADIEFLNDAMWGGPALKIDGASAFSAVPYRGNVFDPGSFMKSRMEKGQRVRVQGSVLFSATEKGWVPEQFGSIRAYEIARNENAVSTGGTAETRKATAQQQAQPQARSRQSRDERAYVAAMKSDLRNLVSAEEAYFAAMAGAYTASLPANIYAVSTGVIGPQITLTQNGYTAKVGHKLSGQTCVIFIGSTPFPPATREGEPQCQPQGLRPTSPAATPQQAQPQARGGLSGDERDYVAAMKSDLRNLVSAEEAYFADHGAYTASLPANMFAVSTGVIGPQITLTQNVYTAKVGHKLISQTCVIFIGSTPLPPATREGEPQCGPGGMTLTGPAATPRRSWTKIPSLPDHAGDMWGSSRTNIWAAGEAGKMFHYDGSNWTQVSTGTTWYFRGIWGTSASDVYVGGRNRDGTAGAVLHYDGANWKVTLTQSGTGVTHTWGSSPTDVYFALQLPGKLLHFNGAAWDTVTTGSSQALSRLWGTSRSDIFAVAEGGTIMHFNGSSWSQMTSGTTEELIGIWGASATDVYVVSGGGSVFHYNGSAWSRVYAGPPNRQLVAIWGSSSKDVYAVGYPGRILHFDGSSWSEVLQDGSVQSLRGVWGSSSGTVWAVGDYGAMFKAAR